MTPEEFKKLKARWYRRLRESGFEDIENDRGDLTDHRTAFDLSQRIGFRVGLMDNVRDYFTWAGHMVWHGKFRTPLDKKIWWAHALGQSSREIGERVKRNPRTVSRKIVRIRAYLKAQKGDVG